MNGMRRRSGGIRFARSAMAVLVTVAVAGGMTSGAAPCKVPVGSRYTTVFRDDLSTRVDDLTDRVVASFSRDDRGERRYPEVVSKYNQPRTVPEVASFTTPHRGTDFGMQWTGEDSDVYAVADGSMVSSKVAYRIGQRIDGTHYAVYMHVKALSGFTAGRLAIAGEKIARVGSTEENGGYNEHLHFGMTVDAAMAVWRPISPFYRETAGWRGGRDLEFVSLPQVDETNVLTLSAYTLTGGAWNEHRQACTGVSVWYRTKGETSWRKGRMEPAQPAEPGIGDAGIDWRFDLGEAGAAGDTIEWYVAAYRDADVLLADDYDITIDAHNYGLFPAGFAHPADAPGSYPSGRSPLFCTTVLQ